MSCGETGLDTGAVSASLPDPTRWAVQRLNLRGASAEPSPRHEDVEWLREEIAQNTTSWRVKARRVLERPLESNPERRLVVIVAPRSEQVLRFSRLGVYDPSVINYLRLTVTFSGWKGALIPEFRREGRIVYLGDPVQLKTSSEAYDVVIPIPEGAARNPPFDEIAFRCTGSYRELGLLMLTLGRRESWADLPRWEDGPKLLSLGGDVRPAVTVFPGLPLIAEALVPQGGVLSLSYGCPAAPLDLTHRPLDLIISSGAEQLAHQRLPLRSHEEAGWQRIVLPLSKWAGRRIQVRISLGEKAPLRWSAVVTTPVISVPDPEAGSVLLVTSDTHRGDHLGVADAGVDVQTPVLDRLASRGTLFADSWSTTNVTNPAHVSLMTGVHPRDVGILSNNVPLVSSAMTLAERFAEAGWITLAVLGVTHLGDDVSGLGQGFDRMDWPRSGQRTALESREILKGWLDEFSGRPVFVWWHVFDAHTPYDPPHDLLSDEAMTLGDPFDAALPLLPLEAALRVAGVEGVRDLRWPRALYGAEVRELDGLLAPIIEHRRFARGHVAVVGDHGEGLGFGDVYFGHAELRRATLHVPMIMAGPGVPVGQRIDLPTATLDLGRTLLDLAGLADSEFPGRNLLSPAGRSRGHQFHVAAGGCSASVRLGDWLLVLHLIDHQPPPSLKLFTQHQLLLFDVSSEMASAADVINDHPEIASRLAPVLVEWLQREAQYDWSGKERDSEALRESLRELGYVSDGDAKSAFFEADDCDNFQRFLQLSR